MENGLEREQQDQETDVGVQLRDGDGPGQGDGTTVSGNECRELRTTVEAQSAGQVGQRDGKERGRVEDDSRAFDLCCWQVVRSECVGGDAGRSRFVGQDADCHFCRVKFEM